MNNWKANFGLVDNIRQYVFYSLKLLNLVPLTSLFLTNYKVFISKIT